MKLRITILVAIGSIIFSATTFAQTSTGKLSLAKGQKFEIENNVQSLVTQEMMGQAIEITIDANLVHQVEVKDKKDSSFLLSSTLTRLVTTGNAMGQAINFDSDKKEDLESPTGKAMQEQLNVAKEVEMNTQAEVINAVKTETKPSTGGQLMDIMNNMTGGGNDQSNGANAAFVVIPGGKKAGDSWSDSTITDELKTYRQYTIRDVKDNIATLVLNGKQVTSKKMEQQGMEININMEGKLSGEEIVDISTGIVQQKTTIIDATGSAEMMGQNIPVTTKVTTKTIVKTK